jgi:hypothetical protein
MTEQIRNASVTPGLRLLYTSEVQVDRPLLLGNSPLGERRIIPILGGAFSGPRLEGRILPGGADWQIIRRDHVVEVEARYTLQTLDGALIYVSNRGVRHGPAESMKRLALGEYVDPHEYYFRTMPVFETGAAEYAWLNGVISVAAGERLKDSVIITVYEVT